MQADRNVHFTLYCAMGFWLCGLTATQSAVDTVTTSTDSGPGSLRATVATASSGDTVVFSAALAGETIYLTDGELLVSNSITIDASTLAGGIRIDGGQNSRVLEIANSNIMFNSLTITNGNAGVGPFPVGAGSGVLVDSYCDLTASNCVFSGNFATLDGGAIECEEYSSLALAHCLISGNTAPYGEGGGLGFTYGAANLNDCVFSNNTSYFGGAIYCYYGPFTLRNCIVSLNLATNGGGMECGDAAVSLTQCTFSGNDASNAGGGIEDGIIAATNCMFFGNAAKTGGAIEDSAGTFNCCIISNNTAPYGGGGILDNSSLPLTFTNCALVTNSSMSGGGGALANGGIVIANNCTFSGNTGTNAGAIDNASDVALNNCTLFGNSAISGNGGAIFNDENLALNNCTLSGNTASNGNGGGIYDDEAGYGTVAVTNTIVADNAATNGADIYGLYSGIANFVGGDPRLSALGSYGGQTQTMPPLPGSPVIDAGVDTVTNFLPTDQRGYPRLAGLHVDIGAVEGVYNAAGAGIIMGATRLANGSFQIGFTNYQDMTFTVLSATNMALPFNLWSNLGLAVESPAGSGQFQFSDTNAANSPLRFYRVASP